MGGFQPPNTLRAIAPSWRLKQAAGFQQRQIAPPGRRDNAAYVEFGAAGGCHLAWDIQGCGLARDGRRTVGLAQAVARGGENAVGVVLQ